MNYFEPVNLPKALNKYRDSDFGTQLKAQFAYYLSSALFLITIPVTINSAYVYSEYHQQIDISIIIVEIMTALVFLTSAIIITKGFYKPAAYMIFTSSFSALWYVIWTDRTELLMKLNTVEYVLAILSMVPIFFEKKKSVIIFTVFNFMMFFLFLAFSDIHIDGSVIDFTVTTSLAMLFISIVAYNITRISSLTLNRVYSDLKRIKNTEKALLEEKEKLLEAQKLVEAAQQSQKLQSLGTLAGGIAHDFNNLLTGIFGYIGFARDESKEENVRKMLTEAAGTIDRARSLTTQLLTFAKGGAPVKKLQPMTPFIQDTVRFALSGSIVKPEFNIAEDLRHVEFDRNQMAQTIENIVLNAVQSMPEGGKIEISAANMENDDRIRISIKDHGTGIPAKLLKNIFDPFFTTKSDGHGLGLAMCYSIVSRHDGSIEVESEEGKGSVFHIILPSRSTSADEKTGNESTVRTVLKNTQRILVLDDEKIVTEIISKIVSGLGYTAVCVHDGESAVDTFIREKNAGEPFCALIFDLNLPGTLNGKEALDKIRKIDADVPAFLSTGYSEEPLVSDPQAHGFTDSIVKPFDINELSEKLHKYLN